MKKGVYRASKGQMSAISRGFRRRTRFAPPFRGSLSIAPACRFFAVESKCQALCAPAGFDELIERSCVRFKATRAQRFVQFGAARICHDAAADNHSIACEAGRLGGVDFDQIWDVCLERRATIIV